MRADEFMTSSVVTVRADTLIADATTLLLARGFSATPVVDEDNRLVGIVSEADLLCGRLGGDTRAPLPPDQAEPLLTVAQVMTSNVISLPETADGAEYAALMIQHKIVSIPVVSGERLVGIVSASDLLKTQAGGEEATDKPQPGSAVRTPKDHRGLRVLGLEECLVRIRQSSVGRLAFIHDGGPVVLPVNHGLDAVGVVFRTTWGSKLLMAEQQGPVAFEVDGMDEDRETGWSVLVTGSASIVYDNDEVSRLEGLGVRSWAGTDEDALWVRILAEDISGREIMRG